MMAMALARCFDDPSVSAVLITRSLVILDLIAFMNASVSGFSNRGALAMMNARSIAWTVPTKCKPREIASEALVKAAQLLDIRTNPNLEENL